MTDKCGSGLARDAGAVVYQLHRGDAIAGKPASTQSIEGVADRRLHLPLVHLAGLAHDAAVRR
jgi:alginate biosynthesis protein AlgK